MIELNKGDKLFTEETLSVFESGNYLPSDLVLVIHDGETIPAYQYQAQYIKTGENV